MKDCSRSAPMLLVHAGVVLSPERNFRARETQEKQYFFQAWCSSVLYFLCDAEGDPVPNSRELQSLYDPRALPPEPK